MIGETVAHYRVTEKLGRGGMGVVYAAEDTRLGRGVALKFLPDDIAGDTTVLERFQREARAASALNHPHICTIYDVGEHQGHPFLVMELLQGRTLADRLTEGPARLNDVFEFGGQIADALEAAHAQGIIHRDIKPANIFITDRRQVKILDFGIAKLTAPRRRTGPAEAASPTLIDQLTSAGMTLGTLAYMSPEQIGGEDVDARTDLYSLGVVLYEMATGRTPFAGRSGASLLQAILVEEPLAPSAIHSDVPDDVGRILVKALDKDRGLRYQTAADLRADLTRVGRSTETQRVRVRTGAAPAARRSAAPYLIHPWDAVARDGREFAEKGAGIMYWFRVPLGGVSYPDGFRNFLQPALDNARISKIRFVLDASVSRTRETWEQLVLPLVRAWAVHANRAFVHEDTPDGGRYVDERAGKTLAWVFVDLSAEFSPCFKLLISDPDALERSAEQAQVFLATATRNARLGDGSLHTIRIPDMILRAESPNDDDLLRALSRMANQWDFLFA